MAQDSGTIPFSPWVVRKRVTFGEPAILGPPIPGSVSHDNPDGLGVGPLRRPVELVKPTKPLPKLPRINREAPRPKRPTSLGKDAPGGASHHKLYGTTVDLGLPPERMRMTNDSEFPFSPCPMSTSFTVSMEKEQAEQRANIGMCE